MRVLLFRVPPGATLDEGAVERLAGQPVYDAPGSRAIVGRVKAAEVRGDEVYVDVALDRALLPHELTVPLSVNPVKQ